jgi:hypothetical protein
MAKDQILSVFLGTELKQEWQAHCANHAIKPSTAIRKVVRKLLSKGTATAPPVTQINEAPDLERRRIELRLTGSEFSKIQALSAQEEVSPNAWIVNLIRANLTRSAQFGMAELRTLGESNSQLLKVGRNLNQIARWMNAHGGSGSLEIQRIEALYQLIREHTGTVASTMRANIDRYTLK